MKTCERCGREFSGRSNRQRWCKGCRPIVSAERRARGSAGPGWYGFAPENRTCESCGRSFAARHPRARFCSDLCRWSTARPAEVEAARRQRYGPVHRRLRAIWAGRVEAGGVRCARCRELIVPGSRWDLGHVDADPSRYAGPEHVRCNRRTAAHRKARESSERAV
jgi:hypothetical protein